MEGIYCSCGKLSYSQKEAQDSAKHLRKRGGGYVKVYKCEKSGNWHLTSWKDKHTPTRLKDKTKIKHKDKRNCDDLSDF